MEQLNSKEKAAISALKKLARNWPSTLWLFATGNSISVMRCNENGSHAINDSGGMDQDYIVDSINIDNDGGDW